MVANLVVVLVSGVVSLVVTLLVNLILDKVRKRSATRTQWLHRAYNLSTELVRNYQRIEKRMPVENRALDEFINFPKQTFGNIALLKSIKKKTDAYNEILSAPEASLDKLNTSIKELKKEIFSAFTLVPNPIRVAILNVPKFQPRTIQGACGVWGIARPSFYKNNLQNFSCQYIRSLVPSELQKYEIIINPYGEVFFLRTLHDQALEEFAQSFKEFLDTGGIWVHTGGLLFHLVSSPKRKKQKFVGVGSRIRDAIGVVWAYSSSSGPMHIRVLDEELTVYGGAYRICKDADISWGEINGETVFGFKRVGSGGIMFYGGLHAEMEVKRIPKLVVKALNLLCLQER